MHVCIHHHRRCHPAFLSGCDAHRHIISPGRTIAGRLPITVIIFILLVTRFLAHNYNTRSASRRCRHSWSEWPPGSLGFRLAGCRSDAGNLRSDFSRPVSFISLLVSKCCEMKWGGRSHGCYERKMEAYVCFPFILLPAGYCSVRMGCM